MTEYFDREPGLALVSGLVSDLVVTEVPTSDLGLAASDFSAGRADIEANSATSTIGAVFESFEDAANCCLANNQRFSLNARQIVFGSHLSSANLSKMNAKSARSAAADLARLINAARSSLPHSSTSFSPTFLILFLGQMVLARLGLIARLPP
jgi:hypothetical protein